jgi:hypothetical protein
MHDSFNPLVASSNLAPPTKTDRGVSLTAGPSFFPAQENVERLTPVRPLPFSIREPRPPEARLHTSRNDPSSRATSSLPVPSAQRTTPSGDVSYPPSSISISIHDSLSDHVCPPRSIPWSIEKCRTPAIPTKHFPAITRMSLARLVQINCVRSASWFLDEHRQSLTSPGTVVQATTVTPGYT